MQPEPLYTTTPSGCRSAVICWPIDTAMHARHLPAFEHEGVTYVPYTGNIVAPYRNNITAVCHAGFYMEYRALATPPQR